MTDLTSSPPNPLAVGEDIPALPVAPANSDLNAMSPEDLERERRRLTEKAAGNYATMSEEDLQRLAYIASTLRRRSSGPPKAARDTKQSSKGKPTLDDVLF